MTDEHDLVARDFGAYRLAGRTVNLGGVGEARSTEFLNDQRHGPHGMANRRLRRTEQARCRAVAYLPW